MLIDLSFELVFLRLTQIFLNLWSRDIVLERGHRNQFLVEIAWASVSQGHLGNVQIFCTDLLIWSRLGRLILDIQVISLCELRARTANTMIDLLNWMDSLESLL